MPVESRSTFQPVRALAIAVLGVAMAVGFMIAILSFTNTSDVLEVRLGDETFEAGDPDKMAEIIDRDGPILYQALVGNRDIYLQHISPTNSANDGWYAFDAVRPGQPRDCFLVWQGDRFLFEDVCDSTKTVDEFGSTQPGYPVRIDNDLLFVDLNASQREDE